MIVRIPEALHSKIVADLRRPHAFAYERVGFAVVGTALSGGHAPLYCVSDYLPVADDGYTPSHDAAATINGSAIRTALQLAMDTRQCIVHVHAHEFSTLPMFSSIDEADHEGLVRSFRNLGIGQPYGFLLFGDGGFLMRIWPAGMSRCVETRWATVIGAHSWTGRRW